ncbi:MAG TPA: thiamine pyrophosphate-dependent enzyme, partial [Acidimicrobiia bacterium]
MAEPVLPEGVGMRKVGNLKPELLLTQEHNLCPGCGEPVALRLFLESLSELGVAQRSVMVAGIGCYTAFTGTVDVDLLQALHGRAPSVATGVKRVRPECVVFTLQGDGDMVNEGLQEVLHTAARGERVTCILLNNGVFGETGGHMTATTVLGQRTKNSLEGRDAEYHGHPILIGDLVARLEGAAYVARGSVHNAGAVARTK